MLLPPPPRNHFRINLALIVAVGVLATFWFLRHLQPWFTEVALVGGSVTLWAVLRLVLELLNKAGGVDPWALTRKRLASPEWTLVLVVALVACIALWLTTSSIYLRFDARSAKASKYDVSVGTVDAPDAFLSASELSSARPVVGRPVFGLGAVGALQCRVIEPAKFEPRDCTLGAFGALSLAVPGDFKPRSFFLLRLVPAPALWSELPPADAAAPAQRLVLSVALDSAPPLVLDDWRLQLVATGSAEADLRALAGTQDDAALRGSLRALLLAEGVPADAADSTLAQLMQPTRTWDSLRVKSGSKLTVDLHRGPRGSPADERVPGFPIELSVGSDAVQNLLIKPKASS